MIRAAIIALLATAPAAFAEAPSASPTPPARPGPVASQSVPQTTTAPIAVPRPKARPVTGPAATQTRVVTPQSQTQTKDPVGTFLNTLFTGNGGTGGNPTNTNVVQKTASASSTVSGVARSPTPPARPENLQRRNTVQRTGFAAILQNNQRRTTSRGSVCGVNTIKGVELQQIPGRIKGCGVAEPVKVTSVAGVGLSQPITVDCPTAVALDTWVQFSVIPTVGKLGGGVSGLHIMASYACRTRNNQRGAKVSEHGRGRAVDVGGIILKNGEQLSVLDDWRSPHGKVMKALHKQACGNFGTVLGPNSDRFHQNHFHFDTASYRSGAYCR